MSWWYNSQLDRIEAAVNSLTVKVNMLLAKEAVMAVDLTHFTDVVTKQTGVTNSVVALLGQITAALKAIPPSNDATTQAAIDALVNTVDANDDTIAAAVVANTPAAGT